MIEIYRNSNGSVIITRGGMESKKTDYTFHVNGAPYFGCTLDGLKEMNQAISKHLKELESEEE